MRILHVIESDGGSSDFIYLLAKYQPNVEHTVLCGDRAWKAFDQLKQQFGVEFPVNLSTVYWESAERELNVLKDLKGIYILFKLIKKYSSEAIHLHSSKAGFLGRLACWLLGKRNVIYTTHAVSFLRKDVSKSKTTQYVQLEKFASKFGGTIVCCSSSESKEMSQYGFQTISIPNGVEMGSPSERLINTSGKITIASVGRLTAQKDPKRFNEIAEKFIDNSNVAFLWIGKGELSHEITSKNIRVTGWLDKLSLYKELSNTDIYISTALWEGMPIAVLEAMAMGLPLVLSNCVGNKDLIREGENGYLFDEIEEAVLFIEKLVQSESLRKAAGLSSKSVCKNEYDIRITAERYLQLYTSAK